MGEMKEEPEKPEKEEKKDPDLLTVEDIREHCKLIRRSVESKESRFILRVLRTVLKTFYTADADKETKEFLLSWLPSAAELDSNLTPSRGKASATPLFPEVDFYISLLVLINLIDKQQGEQAVKCANQIFGKLETQNRRTLDQISAKCYFYFSRAQEMIGQLASVRSALHARLRTATLRNDFEGQAVLINCLLRNYLHYSLYNQADKLVLKCTFPEQASNSEWARFYYYQGRIKATQLDYSEAHKYPVQSSRKAPQNSANGFKQHVTKLSITVELLLGNIPERQVFLAKDLKAALHPYLQVTQAVKSGDVSRFDKVIKEFSAQFKADHTYTLITS